MGRSVNPPAKFGHLNHSFAFVFSACLLSLRASRTQRPIKTSSELPIEESETTMSYNKSSSPYLEQLIRACFEKMLQRGHLANSCETESGNINTGITGLNFKKYLPSHNLRALVGNIFANNAIQLLEARSPHLRVSRLYLDSSSATPYSHAVHKKYTPSAAFKCSSP